MPESFKFVATTYAGLEQMLKEELELLGGENISSGRRMVSFMGDKRLLYKVNYCSRFALRFLREIAEFSFKDKEEFYIKLKALDWTQFLSEKDTIAIQAVTSGDVLPHSKYAAQLSKDAIADFFREKTGIRPSVDLDRPDLRINVHIRNNDCHISLDSSGEPLHKRGWRKEMGEAPLSEVMSAALVKLSGWDGEGEFLDPMCGSGTIVIEAALAALRIPSGKYRKFFSFLKWRDFDGELWADVKAEANAGILERNELQIRACDASWKAVEAVKANVEGARLTDLIKIEKKPFQAVFPRKPSGVIITNPPYDERIKSRNNPELYKQFGDILKQRFQDYTPWVFSGDLNSLKSVGLKATEWHILFNGPIECRLAKFELFTDSEKGKETLDS